MNTSHYALVILMLGVQLAGCINTGAGTGSLAFAPNGEQVCYLKEDRIEEQVVDGKVWSRSISLHWCRVSDPAKDSSTYIDTLGAQYRGYTIFNKAKWSASASWIAVLTPRSLTVVSSQTGKKREITDGQISSIAWLSDSELGYCTRRVRGNTQQRVLCIANVDAQQKRDVAILPERPASGSPGGGEHWSPSGRFAIFMEPECGGQYLCVDVASGTTRSFGQLDAYDAGVAWTPDSGRAFCVSGKVGPDDIHEAILLEPSTGTTVDCTSGFRQAFKDRDPSPEPVWTADGAYVMVNTLGVGGALVQPNPWKLIPLGPMVSPRLHAFGLSNVRPWLFRLPVPGWVGVVPTGNYGDSPILYAADYSGQTVTPLLEGYPREISPDGTTEAVFGADGRIQIRHVGKWLVTPSASNAPRPETLSVHDAN